MDYKKYKFRILSIDGGGIRGIIPAILLAEIEKRTGKQIFEMFDLIAGTSTGGILALALTKPHADNPEKAQFTANDLIQLYRNQGTKIFQEQFPAPFEYVLGPKHGSEGKEGVFQKYFGDTPMKAALKDVFVTSYDTQARRPVFFISNADAEQTGQENSHKVCHGFNMLQAAMATSAAPTFFTPYRVPTAHNARHGAYSLVDGAVYANNPTLLATLEARINYRKKYQEPLNLRDMLIVSLGTGSLMHEYEHDAVAQWGTIQWIQPFFNIVFDGQSEAVDSQLNSFLTGDGECRNYYRFQINHLDEETNRMDDASKPNIQKLQDLAQLVIQQRETWLKELCEQLVTETVTPTSIPGKIGSYQLIENGGRV